ncbi:MAG: 30S ribosomal protein S8 [Candidatus Uhrbacteria bacterium]
MYTDPISDFLTRLRNAQAVGHETVSVPGSKLKLAIAKLLEREGFVGAIKEVSDGVKKSFEVTLKYNDKEPAIRTITRISKPGLRVYRGADELPRVLSGQGIAIVSTSAGIMTNRDARRRRLGGEILCEVS